MKGADPFSTRWCDRYSESGQVGNPTIEIPPVLCPNKVCGYTRECQFGASLVALNAQIQEIAIIPSEATLGLKWKIEIHLENHSQSGLNTDVLTKQ
jgi:hypothetical protein